MKDKTDITWDHFELWLDQLSKENQDQIILDYSNEILDWLEAKEQE